MIVVHKILEQEAENLFSSARGDFPLKLRRAPVHPQRLELIHLPFYLFDVSVERDGERKTMTLSVDGLLGHSVLFTDDHLDFEEEGIPLPCDFLLSPSDAKAIALVELKGMLLEHHLRTRKFSQADEISDGKRVHYPFWVGYFRRRKGYDFKALDAVSGEIQGIRMRKIFLKAFRMMEQI